MFSAHVVFKGQLQAKREREKERDANRLERGRESQKASKRGRAGEGERKIWSFHALQRTKAEQSVGVRGRL